MKPSPVWIITFSIPSTILFNVPNFKHERKSYLIKGYIENYKSVFIFLESTAQAIYFFFTSQTETTIWEYRDLSSIRLAIWPAFFNIYAEKPCRLSTHYSVNQPFINPAYFLIEIRSWKVALNMQTIFTPSQNCWLWIRNLLLHHDSPTIRGFLNQSHRFW